VFLREERVHDAIHIHARAKHIMAHIVTVLVLQLGLALAEQYPVIEAITVATGQSDWSPGWDCKSIPQSSWVPRDHAPALPLWAQPSVDVSLTAEKGAAYAQSLYILLQFEQALRNSSQVLLQYNVTKGAAATKYSSLKLGVAADAPPDALQYWAAGSRRAGVPAYCKFPRPADAIDLDSTVGVHKVDVSRFVSSDPEALVIYAAGGYAHDLQVTMRAFALEAS